MNAFALAFTMIGCFLGAGFVSGQEIWQYFGHYGLWGMAGLALAMLLITLLCAVILALSQRTGINQVQQIAIPAERHALRGVGGAIAVSYMFTVYVVMCAGAGTLLEQLSGSHLLRLVGSAVFCLAITVIAISGIHRAVSVFSKIMPILLILSLVVVVAALVRAGGNGLDLSGSDSRNPLINQWLLSAILYVSYNFFSGMGTLSSIGELIPNRRTLFLGTALGGLMLFLISAGIAAAMASAPACTETQLPMLDLAGKLHPALATVYAIVIFLGMFGASMSVFVPIPPYLFRWKPLHRHPVLVPCVLSLAAWLAGQVGFSTLVGTLYPVYGFFGFFFIAGMLIHARMTFGAERKKGNYDSDP